MPDMTETFRIPEQNKAEASDALDALNRRAARLNVPPVTYTWTAADIEEYFPTTEARLRNLPALRQWWMLTVSAAPVALAGWRFVAVIHPTTEGNIVLPVPGETVPVHFRNASQGCDHCGITIRRNETFVVTHEDGRSKQVGRNCLRDFLGHDPAQVVRWCQALVSLTGTLTGAEGLGGGTRPVDWWPLSTVLRVAAQVTRLQGWVSRGVARRTMGLEATADLVSRLLNSPANDVWVREWYDLHGAPTTADDEAAAACIAWARGTFASDETNPETLSDYDYNLRVIALNNAVVWRTFGLAVSMIHAHQRAVAAQVTRELRARRTAESVFLGEVGERYEFADLDVLDLFTMTAHYGPTTKVTMLDPAGNALVWWASNPPDLSIGDKLTVKARVKKHEEYNGTKYTNITRATVRAHVRAPAVAATIPSET